MVAVAAAGSVRARFPALAPAAWPRFLGGIQQLAVPRGRVHTDSTAKVNGNEKMALYWFHLSPAAKLLLHISLSLLPLQVAGEMHALVLQVLHVLLAVWLHVAQLYVRAMHGLAYIVGRRRCVGRGLSVMWRFFGRPARPELCVRLVRRAEPLALAICW